MFILGISKIFASIIKGKRKRRPQSAESIFELDSINKELKGQWIDEKIELLEYLAKGSFGRVYTTSFQKEKKAVVKIQTIKKNGYADRQPGDSIAYL